MKGCTTSENEHLIARQPLNHPRQEDEGGWRRLCVRGNKKKNKDRGCFAREQEPGEEGPVLTMLELGRRVRGWGAP